MSNDNEPPPKDRDSGQDSKLQKRIKATAEHALVKAFNLMVTTLTTGNYKGSSRGSGIKYYDKICQHNRLSKWNLYKQPCKIYTNAPQRHFTQ